MAIAFWIVTEVAESAPGERADTAESAPGERADTAATVINDIKAALRDAEKMLKAAGVSKKQRQALAKVDAPSLLGEMSLITDRPAVATVMAVTECDYQLLTKPQFQRLIASESLAAYKRYIVPLG